MPVKAKLLNKKYPNQSETYSKKISNSTKGLKPAIKKDKNSSAQMEMLLLNDNLYIGIVVF